MRALLKALIKHLQENRYFIVNDVDVVAEVYDPSYGLSTKTETLSIVDFDKLLIEIDNFAETFNHDRPNQNQP